MSPDTDVLKPGQFQNDPNQPKPWQFVPLLYLLQAMPVAVVQELSSVFYKDLGIADSAIATWTSIVALPWSLQFLLGPLVDLSAKKKQWILHGQIAMVIMLAILPFFILPGAGAFSASLVFLGAFAFVSAMTNIATDGFYMLSMSKEGQASFAGVQTAFYRFGRLLCIALVPMIVGRLMQFNEVKITTGGSLRFAVKGGADKEKYYLNSATFHVNQGELITPDGKKLLDNADKPIQIPGVANDFNIQNGELQIGKDKTQIGLYRMGKLATDNPEEGSWQPTKFPTPSQTDIFEGSAAKRAVPANLAWTLSLFSIALIYLGSIVAVRKQLPNPALDMGPSETQKSEFVPNLVRTLGILGFYGTTYFTLSATWKLFANAIGGPMNQKGWMLPKQALFLGIETTLSGIAAEMIQLAFCLPMAVGLFLWLRSSIRGTEMGEAFSSFFRQSGIIPILFFMLFYRFAEAMVTKMSVLFLKGDHSMGGLALDNTAIGLVKGAIGVAGIICGGIIGGILVSRLGLKKGFWMIAIMMHLPILLYIIAALTKPSSIAIIATIDFIDQFGYGLGYAGYTVYLMRIAQRGQHRTAHYAIGTGLGATFIALSGILGGVIQANGGANGYIHVFVAALLFGIPGLITLAFIPHDEPAESN